MKRISFSPLLFLLLFSYMLIEGTFDPLLILFFSLLHEGGHLLAIRVLGGDVRGFFGRGQGFGLSVGGLSYKGELITAAAGPLVSLLLAGLFALFGHWYRGEDLAYCAFANGALGVMNLLPVMPLDGGRILRAVLALYCTPDQGRKIGRVVGLFCLLPLLGLAFWQFLSSGYNLSLLFICFYLVSLLGENGNDV